MGPLGSKESLLKENINMSANHIELRNDTQRYEDQLYRTTAKEYKVDDVKTTPKRARTSVQISTVLGRDIFLGSQDVFN